MHSWNSIRVPSRLEPRMAQCLSGRWPIRAVKLHKFGKKVNKHSIVRPQPLPKRCFLGQICVDAAFHRWHLRIGRCGVNLTIEPSILSEILTHKSPSRHHGAWEWANDSNDPCQQALDGIVLKKNVACPQ